MIKGSKKQQLSKSFILSKISSYDIFKYYMPHNNWEVNVATYSPFRDEKTASFFISAKYSTESLTFIDFGDTKFKGDCFTFVMNLYNISNFVEVLKKIDLDFGLGITIASDTGKYKKIVTSYSKPEIKTKEYSFIQVKTRNFTQEDLSYWNDYYQDIDDLKANNVYSISDVYLNKKRIVLNDNELRFGYLYNGNWKIYKPFSEKKWKWVPNNVPITEMDGKEDIKNCHTAFITKSKKDYMVMKKIFPTVCAVQNEGVACFSYDNVQYIKDNSKKQILSFDSDTTGVKNSINITNMFGFDYCNTPKKYLEQNINDWADLAKEYGIKVIENYLINKNIIK